MAEINSFDALIGLLIPILVGFLSARSWSGWIKSLMVLGFSLLAGLARVYLSGELNFNNLTVAILTILAVAGVSYQTITKELAKKLQEVGPVK
jgi:biotin transporter BioY